ncbi:MAG TPA: nitrate- and nitrite sensing domain-containing protein [Hyphomicrobiales bacterium]|nr:nitrate- and nitrite sensing domain-containing protein [Hyphomicrobiales bacterium]
MSLIEKRGTLNAASTIGDMVEMMPTISALIHALQKERDSAVGLLVTENEGFRDLFERQIRATDGALETYQELGGPEAHRDHAAMAHHMMDLTADVSGELAKRTSVRADVENRGITAEAAIAYYTSEIEGLLRTMELTAKLSREGHVIRTIVAYASVLRGKEMASQERLAGVRGFAAGDFSQQAYKEFVRLEGEQYVNLRIADRFDTHEDGVLLKAVDDDDAVREVDRLRRVAEASAFDGGVAGVSARNWYDASTARIEHLEEVAQESAHHLMEHMAEEIAKAAGDFYAALLTTILTVGATLAFGAAVILSITRPIAGLVDDMCTLAEGDTSIEPEGRARGDEIGDMARAVVVFRDNARDRNLLQERALNEERERQARQQRVEGLIEEFRARIQEMLLRVGAKMDQMKTTAAGLTGIASRASENAGRMSLASNEASSNVNTVAQASDDLTASIHEISNKIAETTKVVTAATTAAKESNEKVSELAAAAQKIGDVLSLIRDIAEQTNLLALNATIEAARAGEFGKGFAVVASEVKTLASQTASATEEITQQIAAIQGSTGDAVNVIQSIAAVMTQVHQYTEAIAAAVEEQGAATEEISRNVREAAAGTERVAVNADGLSSAVAETDGSASQLVDVSAEVSQVTTALRDEIDNFLKKVAS